MIESRTIRFGDKVKVGIRVHSISNTPFEIKNASFKLLCGEEVETSGTCDIVENGFYDVDVFAMIKPLRANAIYYLEYRYDIADENLSYLCEIKVVRGDCMHERL